ncbi:MAG TPA: protease modulator HflC [Myxococcota bacterium]|jgi:membrane protease subunit HflC|nr:protease modulator HflC [Myxococcota bacterium]
MRSLLLLVAIALGIAAVASSVFVVDETEHAVITQFGRPVAVVSEAGLHAKLPAPFQRVALLDKRTLFSLLQPTELLTADKKNIVVSSYLTWRIVDPLKYLTTLRSREFAEARLASLVQSLLGSQLGSQAFSSIVPAAEGGANLVALEDEVERAAQEVAAHDFGIEITRLGLTRLSYPPQNLQSVFARMRAERERIARAYRSEGKAEAQKIRAEADRERATLLANAEAEAARLQGEGEAEAARVYANAYHGHEDFYRFLRTLQAYEKALKDNTTLVLPADSPFLDLLLSRLPGARNASGGGR